jgi:hypothetical protein
VADERPPSPAGMERSEITAGVHGLVGRLIIKHFISLKLFKVALQITRSYFKTVYNELILR